MTKKSYNYLRLNQQLEIVDWLKGKEKNNKGVGFTRLAELLKEEGCFDYEITPRNLTYISQNIGLYEHFLTRNSPNKGKSKIDKLEARVKYLEELFAAFHLHPVAVTPVQDDPPSP